jgi:SAM-dependent methyltransferase
MSAADQKRWNERYAAGAYGDRSHPSAALARWLPRLSLPPGSRALDLACGAGRNACYLAEQGHQVVAVDGSAVAIERLQLTAAARQLTVETRILDLEPGLSAAAGTFALIVLVRYVNFRLLSQLPALLAPGGYLFVEEHLQVPGAPRWPLAGPGRAAFRVAPGSLPAAVPSLCCLSLEEGYCADPDGRRVALARMLARRRPASV